MPTRISRRYCFARKGAVGGVQRMEMEPLPQVDRGSTMGRLISVFAGFCSSGKRHSEAIVPVAHRRGSELG